MLLENMFQLSSCPWEVFAVVFQEAPLSPLKRSGHPTSAWGTAAPTEGTVRQKAKVIIMSSLMFHSIIMFQYKLYSIHWNIRGSVQTSEATFFTVWWWNTEQISLLGDLWKPSRNSLGQPAPGDPAWAGSCTRWLPEVLPTSSTLWCCDKHSHQISCPGQIPDLVIKSSWMSTLQSEAHSWTQWDCIKFYISMSLHWL